MSENKGLDIISENKILKCMHGNCYNLVLNKFIYCRYHTVLYADIKQNIDSNISEVIKLYSSRKYDLNSCIPGFKNYLDDIEHQKTYDDITKFILSFFTTPEIQNIDNFIKLLKLYEEFIKLFLVIKPYYRRLSSVRICYNYTVNYNNRIIIPIFNRLLKTFSILKKYENIIYEIKKYKKFYYIRK